MRPYEIFSGKDLEVAELILRRRMQLLVHSYIYYNMDTNIIPDNVFDKWGRELVQLQADYSDIASKVDYADVFEDWDASTGFHLPENDQIETIACRLTRKPNKQIDKPVVKNKTPKKKSLF